MPVELKVKRHENQLAIDDSADLSLTLEEYHRVRNADIQEVKFIEHRPRKYS